MLFQKNESLQMVTPLIVSRLKTTAFVKQGNRFFKVGLELRRKVLAPRLVVFGTLSEIETFFSHTGTEYDWIGLR
jgi:hypothetical protein